LANVTLRVSYRLLSLYESDARVDYDKLSLGVGDFTAYIDKSCSGYEGMGLVTAFLSLFLWVFRRSLLFPNALALIPIGVGAIWLLTLGRMCRLRSQSADSIRKRDGSPFCSSRSASWRRRRGSLCSARTGKISPTIGRLTTA